MERAMLLRNSCPPLAAIALTAALLGCGSKSNGGAFNPGGPDGGFLAPDDDAATLDEPDTAGPPGYPATHPALPTVANLGGPVAATPLFVPILFPNDGFEQQIGDFIAKVGASSYWKGNVAEYGVGPATMGVPVHFPTTPTFLAPSSTADDSALQAWLTQEIASGALPAYTPGTIYILFTPDGTSITLQGGTSCTEFGGYHNEVSVTSVQQAPSAVVPRCASYGGLTGMDVISGSASHELIEAATDPFPQTKPAYAQVDDKDIGWMILLGGGEIGDMCAQNVDAFFQPPDLAYTVQRTWSNKAALASADPCIPAPTGLVYFNAAPVMPDKIPLNIGKTVMVQGAKIALGKSLTIPVDLFSDDPMGSWQVTATDGASLQGAPPQLSFKLNKALGQNGAQLMLTITVDQVGQYGVETFALASQTRTNVNLWIGLISSQ